MNRSMQDETNRSRDSFVSAASEKYFDHVQPPSEISTFRFGMALLERLELLEVAEDRPRPGDLLARDGLVGGPRPLVVGPLVAELADDVAVGVRSDVAEGVVDDGQPSAEPLVSTFLTV